MKKAISILLLFSLIICVIPAAHADLMSDARGMLQMINDFRTGDDAWYWNSDNRTVTQKTGLGRLQYDEELEAVALVRANELAECFDHTRPDGTDCFTAFPDNREYVGENIACGYLTAEETFEGFLEENENYAGQGHRRIMLMGEMTRVGLAAVEVNGTRYWVQEFASDPMESLPASTGTVGWEQHGEKWFYRKADGSLVIGWMLQGGNWYYMDRDGAMHTGWLQDGGAWYYMKDSGEMATGWMEKDGKWFYLSESGVMQSGWLRNGGNWYYMDRDGVMQTGWVDDGGSRYYMDGSGAMVTGWKQVGGKWYYLRPSGVVHTGWLQEGNTWYYMYSDGEMATGNVTINGSTESFGSNGAWQGTVLDDYGTPLGTENPVGRLVKAIWQAVLKMFAFE